MATPNLFDFATSELSQDAFICWLASWADPALKEQNEPLHATATAFLTRLLEVGKGPKVSAYRSIAIHQQWKSIEATTAARTIRGFSTSNGRWTS